MIPKNDHYTRQDICFVLFIVVIISVQDNRLARVQIINRISSNKELYLTITSLK